MAFKWAYRGSDGNFLLLEAGILISASEGLPRISELSALIGDLIRSEGQPVFHIILDTWSKQT
ncbi:hypothetical protein EAW52_24210 [Pseudomonas sp. LTJR-52]|nr:hypothetical protein EAW52_24210 [Pseudomonas sp. LTJR-52]